MVTFVEWDEQVNGRDHGEDLGGRVAVATRRYGLSSKHVALVLGALMVV